MDRRIFGQADAGLFSDGAYVVPPHVYGVFVCRSGFARMAVGERVYRVDCDTMFIYVPFTVIRVLERSADWAGDVFEQSVDFVFSTLSVIPVGKRQAVRSRPCVRISPAHRERIEELAVAATRRSAWAGAETDEVRGDILSAIARKLAEAVCLEVMAIYFECVPLDDSPLNKANLVYNRFISSVFRNCERERTVVFYAREQHFSPGHFSAVIKDCSGQSALKWIETVTLSRVKQLLRRSDLSVKEISDRLNFSEQSAFGRFFRRHEGISPSAYRKRFAEVGPTAANLSERVE